MGLEDVVAACRSYVPSIGLQYHQLLEKCGKNIIADYCYRSVFFNYYCDMRQVVALHPNARSSNITY